MDLNFIDIIQITITSGCLVMGCILAFRKSGPEMRNQNGQASKNFADAAETAGELTSKYARELLEVRADVAQLRALLNCTYRLTIDLRVGESPLIVPIAVERVDTSDQQGD
jgi:hypothetical protein